jgi:hypothetical protein
VFVRFTQTSIFMEVLVYHQLFVELQRLIFASFSFSFILANIGSDVSALAWMKSWWSSRRAESEDEPSQFEAQRMLTEEIKRDAVLFDAFRSIYNSSQWINRVYPDTKLSPQSFLTVGPSAALFPFSDEITTSFYPMIELQFMQPVLPDVAPWTKDRSSRDDATSGESKILDVFRYFEGSMGRYFDSDNDGVRDSYQYNSALSDPQKPLAQFGAAGVAQEDQIPTGNYSIWATANLLLAMVYPKGLNQQHFLRDMFQSKLSLFLRTKNQPKVIQSAFEYLFPSFFPFGKWICFV